MVRIWLTDQVDYTYESFKNNWGFIINPALSRIL